MQAGSDANPAAAFTNTDKTLWPIQPVDVQSDMDELATKAAAAAVEVAADLGLRNVKPVLLKEGSNAIFHLQPAPVVARVSTTIAMLRTPPERWLQRDLDLATWLNGQGAAVVPPTPELPPGPHLSSVATGSCAITFWTFVEHNRDRPPGDEETAIALHALHQTLKSFPGGLPFLGPLLEELPHWLHWLEQNHALPAADLIALRQAQWALANSLLENRSPLQPLHGDAHRGNLLRTPQGLLWTDFEDACLGPIAWDVAILISRDPANADDTLAAYVGAPSWHELTPFLQARSLEAVIYQQVLGRRFPHRAEEAAAALTAWHRRASH